MSFWEGENSLTKISSEVQFLSLSLSLSLTFSLSNLIRTQIWNTFQGKVKINCFNQYERKNWVRKKEWERERKERVRKKCFKRWNPWYLHSVLTFTLSLFLSFSLIFILFLLFFFLSFSRPEKRFIIEVSEKKNRIENERVRERGRERENPIVPRHVHLLFRFL